MTSSELSPWLIALMTVLLVILVDRVWHIPDRFNPVTLYRLMVLNLATRVLPDQTAPTSQHYISGTLGIIVLMVPMLVVVAIIISAMEFKQVVDGLILFGCVGFYNVRKQYKAVVYCLSKQKKLLARERVSHLVARQTDRLSDIGIAKAAIESYLLRFLQQFIGVLFWFLLAGPIAALGYRLLLEFRWQWHRQRPGFERFSIPAYYLTQVLIWPGYVIGTMLLMLVTSPLKGVAAWRSARQKDLTSTVLAMFGGSMNIILGGPNIYNDHTVRHQRVGGANQVRFSDLTYVLRAINRATWLGMILLTLVMITSWQITK